MIEELCYFGFVNQVRALKTAIALDLGRGVKEIIDAVQGLEAISQEEYPLILFNSPTPVGDLPLPDDVSLHDWVSTDYHIIKCARQIRPRTPIIVIHYGTFPRGYKPERAIRKYNEAGATDCFNAFKFDSTRPFIDFIRPYL